jgi:hypothetical protein
VVKQRFSLFSDHNPVNPDPSFLGTSPANPDSGKKAALHARLHTVQKNQKSTIM